MHIVSGVSGAGKSTLIKELERRGHFVVHEAATRVWNRTQSWTAREFAALVLKQQIEDVNCLPRLSPLALSFSDRSPINTVGHDPSLSVPDMSAYAAQVFWLPRILATQVTTLRPDTLPERHAKAGVIRKLYENHGFELIEIQGVGVEERADFVLQEVIRLKRRQKGIESKL